MTNLNDKTIKFNLQSLQTKLAIQILAPENTFTRTGRTYQVFSYDQILQRRNRAGLIWVRKTKGVEFVSLNAVQDQTTQINPLVVARPTVVSQPSARDAPDQQSIPQALEPTVVVNTRDNLGRSTTGTGVVSTTQIGTSLGTSTNETASTTTLPIQLPKILSRYFPAIDHSAVETLWNDCRDRAPDCTAEEVLYFINQKLPISRSGKIQNPVGFLITTVPKCFEGETFQHFRHEQARLREEQRIREEEECRKQQAIEEELDQYRRQEEAQRKAEQVLATLSEEERKTLYDEASEQLRARGYTAERRVIDQTIQRTVIKNLAKRILAEAQSTPT